MSVIDKANNQSVPANNQESEGSICYKKTNDRDLKGNLLEPGAYFWYWYNTNRVGSKYMISEMERYKGYLEKRRNRLAKMRKEEATDTKVKRTNNSKDMEEEDKTNMI